MDRIDKSKYDSFVKENYGSWEEFKQYCVELPKIVKNIINRQIIINIIDKIYYYNINKIIHLSI